MTCAAYIRLLKKRVMAKTMGMSTSATMPSSHEKSHMDTTMPISFRQSITMLIRPSENREFILSTSVFIREAVSPEEFAVK